MESIAKSDIFFTVSSIAFAVLTVLLVVVLFYVIKIVKNLHEIVETAKKKTHELSHKLEDVEEYIKSSRVMNFVSLLFNKRKKPKARVTTKE